MDSPQDSTPLDGGYDGWAIINLGSLELVRSDQRGCEVLGLNADELPTSFTSLLTKTDADLVTNRVVDVLVAGNQWRGGLRLAGRDLPPTPVLFVPHVAGDVSIPPEFTTVLFALDATGDAAAAVPDPLTGLPTRSALFRRLEQALRHNRDTSQLLGIFFLDLDGLKKINDRYGHEVGDTALIETAQRITAHLPDGALVVRFGGDEFVIVHERIADVAQAQEFARQIISALNEPGDYHAISASVGVSLTTSGTIDPHDLIRRADAAMYRAKARGGSQVAFYDAEMQNRQRDDELLRSNLLDAISTNGFGVAAQPIYELATGAIHSAELFIRLREDAPYITSANQLFRLAHEYGEVLDAAVLGRALGLAQAWHGSFGARAPRVQVNVSTQSLAAAAFARRVGDALTTHGIRPAAIALEIDAQDLAAAGERERKTVEALRQLGVPLVVDGFGDNELTLHDLVKWQPSMVKVAADAKNASVITGLVRGISALRIPTVLKGVGTPADLAHAVGIGTFGAQGNALTPVRRVQHVNSLVHGPPRIGF